MSWFKRTAPFDRLQRVREAVKCVSAAITRAGPNRTGIPRFLPQEEVGWVTIRIEPRSQGTIPAEAVTHGGIGASDVRRATHGRGIGLHASCADRRHLFLRETLSRGTHGIRPRRYNRP